MSKTRDSGKRFFPQIARRWPIKVLSVVVAIVLFVFHRLGNLEERFFSIPLNVETSGELVPSSPYPQNIKVTLRGGANSIYPVLENDVEAYIDFGEYEKPGNYKAPVQIRKRGTALGTEDLEITVDPMEISLELDVRASSQIQVKPNLQGNPENNFELVSYTLSPNRMTVDGPQKLVAALTELSSDPIDLRNRNADFELHLRVHSPNPLLSIRGDGMTLFSGIVRELIVIRSFDGIPLEISGLPETLTARFEPVSGSVRLEGPQRLIEGFEPQPGFLGVDCSSVTGPGTWTLPVLAAIPGGLNLSRQEPLEVTVEFSEKRGRP